MLKEGLALIFVLSGVTTPSAPLDVHTIIQQSVEANTADWNAAPEYDCFERDKENGGTKTYAELMLFGSPYERLIERNGKPLATGEQAKERRKLQETIARRRNESKQQRTERLTKYEKERKRDHLMMEQMTRAFDFKLMGEQKIGTHDVYVLKATPRAGYQPPNTQAEALTGMQGRLWIDKITFQWVRVEAEVTRPVSIEGFLARVEPGTRFELEKTPVASGVWLPKHFAMRAPGQGPLSHYSQIAARSDVFWVSQSDRGRARDICEVISQGFQLLICRQACRGRDLDACPDDLVKDPGEPNRRAA